MRGFDLRQPVPIRDMERERKASASGPVKTYTLPPEEIERIFAKNKPPKTDMPGYTRSMAEARQASEAKRQHTEEDKPMDMTRGQYLQLRLDGQSRTAICKAHATSPPMFYKQLADWGIKLKADEEKVLEELRGLRKPEPAPATKTIVDVAEEMAEVIAEEVAEPTPGIDWFTFGAEPQTTEATVSIADKSFAFDAWTAQTINVKPGDRVAIGYADGRLYFRRDDSGMKLQKHGKYGARVQSDRLPKWPHWSRIAKKRYPVRMQDGMIVAEVGGE